MISPRISKAAQWRESRTRHIVCRLLACGSIAILVSRPASPQDIQPAQKGTKPNAGFGSIYCGPRCVQRVLREYQIETELVDLIREMQWPAAENGSSFATVAAALDKRGISTKAVDLDPGYDIEWTHPAIVHLEQNGVAHYVVWMPPTEPGSSGRVWDNDVTGAVKGQFNLLRTGPVLLTSDRAIPDSAVVGRRLRPLGEGPSRRALVPVLLGICGFICGWLANRQRPAG